MFYRITLSTITLFMVSTAFAEELTLKQTETGYEIRVDDKVFAGYVTDYEGSPIIYPIVGPTGKNMTRDYPMLKEYKEVKADHPHHRSLWFTHGNVNNFDFWAMKCSIVHKRFIKAECDGQTVLFVTENDWIGNENQVVCRDIRSLRFSVSKNRRIIDFDITITAVQDKVTFGDTKEGTFGIRVPEAIAAETKRGGTFSNAEGKSGEKEAWGKRSAWVDYSGIIDGERVGITVMNHPASFRFPTYWHVRDYGLLSANPFGAHDFEQLQDNRAGNHTLAEGESFMLHYRVLLHAGDINKADIAAAYREYVAEKK